MHLQPMSWESSATCHSLDYAVLTPLTLTELFPPSPPQYIPRPDSLPSGPANLSPNPASPYSPPTTYWLPVPPLSKQPMFACTDPNSGLGILH